MPAHVNDVGTAIRLRILDQDGIDVDLSTATSLTMLLTKPDGTVVSKTAIPVPGGLTSEIEYITIAGDLAEPGTWQAQGQVVIGTGAWSSDVLRFLVKPNLE